MCAQSASTHFFKCMSGNLALADSNLVFNVGSEGKKGDLMCSHDALLLSFGHHYHCFASD